MILFKRVCIIEFFDRDCEHEKFGISLDRRSLPKYYRRKRPPGVGESQNLKANDSLGFVLLARDESAEAFTFPTKQERERERAAITFLGRDNPFGVPHTA